MPPVYGRTGGQIRRPLCTFSPPALNLHFLPCTLRQTDWLRGYSRVINSFFLQVLKHPGQYSIRNPDSSRVNLPLSPAWPDLRLQRPPRGVGGGGLVDNRWGTGAVPSGRHCNLGPGSSVRLISHRRLPGRRPRPQHTCAHAHLTAPPGASTVCQCCPPLQVP